MKRHKDALGIEQGARNIRAIARSLVEAADEAAREGIGAEQDAAVRIMVHQLARVCNVDEIRYGFDPRTLKDVYCTLMAECVERAKEIPVRGSHQAPGEADSRPFTQIATSRHQEDDDVVAVVMHGGGAVMGEDKEDDFSGSGEPRRSLLSRFLGRS